MTLIERVYNYAYDIIEGEINACKKHIQACQRFIDDINNVENEDYAYYFDVNELEDFYEWSKLFKHTKGILAGKYVELTDFQLFIVANIFCWKDKATGNKRFRYIYIQLARKNAKSQLLALIASYIAFLSDEQEEVYIGATIREQSQIVYNEIKSQIQAAPIVKGKYKDSYGKITHLKSGSVIQPLSKDSGRTGDGLNPSCAIIDEYHAHKTDEIYEVMKSGMVARKQPLMVIITTAGLDLSYPCYKEYQYVSKILDPESVVANDNYFALICELDEEDDIKDESNWIKANPIVATYDEGLKSIRSDLQTALDVPEKMTKFLTKNMNIWVQSTQGGYMDFSKWNKCGTEELPDLTGKEVYIGCDLSSTLDLTSVSFIVPHDGEFIVLSHSFLPQERMREKIKMDKVPYDLWEREGWLTLTNGEIVDYNFVEKFIVDQVEKYQWKPLSFCYDEWNATDLTIRMQQRGYITVKVVQGMKTLAPPTKKFRDLVYEGKIIHNNNPVLNWAMGNAITKLDHNANFMLDKSKSTQRIDPVASIMTSFSQAQGHYNNGLGEFLELTDETLDNLGW
ncbi:terminase large subunit [Priestia koreensis]|uniref:terminase large subunit n=1 Tax=Priestia koreensis TaxID=284581 RepID=UPI003D0225AF